MKNLKYHIPIFMTTFCASFFVFQQTYGPPSLRWMAVLMIILSTGVGFMAGAAMAYRRVCNDIDKRMGWK